MTTASMKCRPTPTAPQRVLLHTQPLIMLRRHGSMPDLSAQRYVPLCLLWPGTLNLDIDSQQSANQALARFHLEPGKFDNPQVATGI